jgi:TetR/AcrR family fatty acid metabolism transcriptional regulator
MRSSFWDIIGDGHSSDAVPLWTNFGEYMGQKKVTKRRIQAEETKNRIYSAAIKLMDKRGFDGITIADIGKAAGISVGGFYHYFTTKHDILAEIFHRADVYFSTVVARDLSASRDSAAEKILAYFDSYADFNLGTGIKTMQQLYTPKTKFFVKKGRPMQVVLKGLIAEGQARGELTTDLSPDALVTFLFTFARGIVYEWCLLDGKYNLKKYMREYMEKLISTIATH